MSSAHAIKPDTPKLLRIGYRDATTGKLYEFLTNNFQLAPATIAAITMITNLLLALATRHSAKSGWGVLRIMRVIQLNFFDRRSFKSILMPEPPDHKKSEPQMRLAL